MAIVINQQPTTPNYSYNDLVFVLSSTNITETEFSFVVDITVGTDTFRYRKQPNPTSRGVVNISSIINDELDFEVEALGVSVNHTYASQVKDFSIVFSEEFQNAMGVLEIVNPTTAVPLRIIKGVVPNDTSITNATLTIPAVLSALPTTGNRIHRDADITLTHYDSGTITAEVISIPASVSSFMQNVGGTNYTFEVYDEESLEGDVGFYWFNSIGGLDFYTANQESTSSTSVTKSTSPSSSYHHGFTTALNLDDRNANVWKSQQNTYKIDYDQTFTKNTEWLDKEHSDYVAGLFDSPCVYIKEGTRFRPVEILNSSYQTQSTMRSQALFNYTIMYRFINNKKSI